MRMASVSAGERTGSRSVRFLANRALVVTLLLFGSLAARPLRAADVDSLALARGRAAMWRSALVGGWGQAYNGDWIKAGLFFGGEVSILLAARSQNMEWRDWRRTRLAAEDEELRAFAATRQDFYLVDRNKLLWWWLWLKLGGVLDAYVCGALSNFDTDWDGEVVLLPLPEGGARLSLGLPLDGWRRKGQPGGRK